MDRHLEYWLGQAYHARVTQSPKLAEIKRIFAKRLAADQSLKAAALDELKRTTALKQFAGEMERRCYVSHIQHEILCELLGSPT